MSRRLITRSLLFTAIVLLLASPFWLSDYRLILTLSFFSALLIVCLWMTSRSETRSLLVLSLNRIALAGFGLVALWGSLNQLRGQTYNGWAENRSPWNAVYWYTVDVQDFLIRCGVALAAIFFVVLFVGVMLRTITHLRKARSLRTTNV
jgi:hypothetical protein